MVVIVISLKALLSLKSVLRCFFVIAITIKQVSHRDECYGDQFQGITVIAISVIEMSSKMTLSS